MPEVAAVPFALTGGPLPKPPRRAQTTLLPKVAAAWCNDGMDSSRFLRGIIAVNCG